MNEGKNLNIWRKLRSEGSHGGSAQQNNLDEMVDEWNKQKCMKRADNRATDIDLQSSF